MHRGSVYHDLMLASARDLKVRERFQRLVCRLAPPGGTILDFGAGTGIDAKVYADRKFRVIVHEPDQENRAYLAKHCKAEFETGDITDLAPDGAADVIAADFAVLNLIADHKAQFARFSQFLGSTGHVVISLLNPFFLGDARYAWWRTSLSPLLRNGSYAVDGDDGPIYRFTPSAVVRAALPKFTQVELHPSRSGLAMSRYMFMVFRKEA
jgi:ubiquinone/menaquinone biosynthesis C-methylase UbiE